MLRLLLPGGAPSSFLPLPWPCTSVVSLAAFSVFIYKVITRQKLKLTRDFGFSLVVVANLLCSSATRVRLLTGCASIVRPNVNPSNVFGCAIDTLQPARISWRNALRVPPFISSLWYATEAQYDYDDFLPGVPQNLWEIPPKGYDKVTVNMCTRGSCPRPPQECWCHDSRRRQVQQVHLQFNAFEHQGCAASCCRWTCGRDLPPSLLVVSCGQLVQRDLDKCVHMELRAPKVGKEA